MDKLHIRDENVQYTTQQKISNFFYHYKWHVAAVCFVVFVILWVVISSFGQGGEEAYIGYIGEYAYSHSEKDEISQKMSSLLNIDLDGDGECTLEFQTFHFYSDSQIEQLSKTQLKEGEDLQFHPEYNKKNYEHFLTELENGNTAVWLVSKEVYEQMDKSVLLPIEDVLGYIPDSGAIDEYAIDCSVLPFSYDTTREITYNSYLVLRVKRAYSFIMGEAEAARELEDAKRLYTAIVQYTK